MKKLITICLLVLISISSHGQHPAAAKSSIKDKKTIKQTLTKVADWQIEHYNKNGFKWPVKEWVNSTFYIGLYKLSLSLNEKKYIDQLVEYSKKANWKVGEGKRRYFADDYLIGDLYCRLYEKYKQPEMIVDFKAMADELLIRKRESLEFKNEIVFREWAWCDALFMGPPSLAALADVTDNKAYLNLMDTLWHNTYNFLYDKEEHLFYRDERYFNKREPNGQKVFWSRGNGWVMAGLARQFENMPKNSELRGFYETIFKDMAAKIISIQQPDGMWRASLLDPAVFPAKETSGTGFYCYALAWGINNGLLDKKTYLPPVEKAWAALNECVHPDGKLGYVQKIGEQPGKTTYEDTDGFGVGGFLLAGVEVLKLK